MAYSSTNRPFLRTLPPIGGGFGAGSSDAGGKDWYYRSTHDSTTVRAGHITDADSLGMKVGDTLVIYDTGTPAVTLNWVSAVSTAGAATLVLASS